MIGELQGLTTDQVAERVREGKINTLPERSGRTTWQIVRDNVFTRVNAMLAVLFVIVAATMQFAQGAFAILIVANSIIGMVQELRAKSTLDNLAVIGEAHPVVLRDGQRVSLPRDQVVADDLIALSPGDQVVVDGEVVAADYLEVDESMLTGEADPVAKSVGDELMSGAFVVSGSGVYRATKVGAEAYAAQLTAQAAKFTLVNSELRAGIDRILKFVTWLLIPAGLLTIWVQFRQPGTTWQESALRMVGALVPMIPEGLVLLTSMAFALGVIRLGRRKCLVQELPAIEGLARVSVVCADKTGTLTQNAMTLGEVIPLAGDADEVTEVEARSVMFANAGEMKMLILAPDANLSDGLIDVIAVDAQAGLLGWADVTWKMLGQLIGLRPVNLPVATGTVAFRQAKGASVTSKKAQVCQVDGDAIGVARTMHVRMQAGALDIAVPAERTWMELLPS